MGLGWWWDLQSVSRISIIWLRPPNEAAFNPKNGVETWMRRLSNSQSVLNVRLLQLSVAWFNVWGVIWELRSFFFFEEPNGLAPGKDMEFPPLIPGPETYDFNFRIKSELSVAQSWFHFLPVVMVTSSILLLLFLTSCFLLSSLTWSQSLIATPVLWF